MTERKNTGSFMYSNRKDFNLAEAPVSLVQA